MTFIVKTHTNETVNLNVDTMYGVYAAVEQIIGTRYFGIYGIPAEPCTFATSEWSDGRSPDKRYHKPHPYTETKSIYLPRSNSIPPEIMTTRQGIHGNLFIIDTDGTLKLPWFSTEFMHPYHHKILQDAAIERAVMSVWPKPGAGPKYADIVESVMATGTDIYVHMTSNPKKATWLLHAMRQTYLPSTTGYQSVTRPLKNRGSVTASPTMSYMASSIRSTWFNDDIVDKEIQNFRHFKLLTKTFNPKILEAYFLDVTNAVQYLGMDPDPYTVDSQIADLVDIPEGLMEAIHKTRPSLIRGGLKFEATKYTWSPIDSECGLKPITFHLTPRLKGLQRRLNINDGDIARMWTRYQSVGAGGQFTMTPRSVVRYIEHTHDIKYEGFGAPFNVDLDFCSLMFDVDVPFGSMGPFSWRQLVRRQGNWSINPPFTEYIFELTMSSILKACEHLGPHNTTQFHVLFPGWEHGEEPEFNRLMDIMTGKTESPYMVSTTLMDHGEYSFERTNGQPLYLIHGGLLYAVFSPAGLACGFTESDMQNIRDKFAETVPARVKQNVFGKKDTPWAEKA